MLAVVFGLLSPAFTGLMLQAPKAFIMALAGLAMLRVLQAAFIASFKDRSRSGALVSFLVTVADLQPGQHRRRLLGAGGGHRRVVAAGATRFWRTNHALISMLRLHAEIHPA